MRTQHRNWSVIGFIALIAALLACTLPGATHQPTATLPPLADKKATPLILASTATATPTPGLSLGGSTGGTGGNNGGSNGGSNGGGNGGNNGGGNGGNTGGSSSESPTQLPETYAGPYAVKQIESLGGEVISGFVCSLTQPFGVLSATPHVTFTFVFVPQNAQKGNVSYSYSIPSAGESHDASGTYSLSPVDKSGTLQVSLSVSDHVVFKGFDGKMPERYMFDLVPSDNTGCKPAP